MIMAQLTLYCVDHEPVSRVVLKAIFDRDHDVEVFPDAQSCLERIAARCPDMILADVDVPGMNGYDLCRHIKDDYTTRHVPVVFISRKEDLDSRLEGYQSGGEDFIIKPYALDEVRGRVAVVQRALEGAAHLRQQVSDAETLSSLLLSNMDEYAVLIKFMRALNESEDIEGIVQSLLSLLGAFRLQGAVQVRTPWQTVTLSEEGRDRPLETAVIKHMANMERIFEFKQRSVYNFEHVTILVTGMPIHDSDLCGRLRDHLAIAAEMADARVRSLIGGVKLQSTQAGLAEVLEQTRVTVSNYIDRQTQLHKDAAGRAQGLIDRLILSFAPLGLSQELEEELTDMLLVQTRGILRLFQESDDTVETLAGLVRRLESVLNQT